MCTERKNAGERRPECSRGPGRDLKKPTAQRPLRGQQQSPTGLAGSVLELQELRGALLAGEGGELLQLPLPWLAGVR